MTEVQPAAGTSGRRVASGIRPFRRERKCRWRATRRFSLPKPTARRGRTGRQRAENGRGNSGRIRNVARFSAEAREQLIVGHLPLVKHVLGRVAAHLPAHVDRSDLLEAGALGLIDAADRFDPARNVRFHTYAMTRIRGAMLDALRSADWLPRSVRSGLGCIARASAELEQEPTGLRPRPTFPAARDWRNGRRPPEGAAERAFYSLDDPPQACASLQSRYAWGSATRMTPRSSPGPRGPRRGKRASRGGHSPPVQDRAARHHSLLLRAPGAARDRRGAPRDRLARLPDSSRHAQASPATLKDLVIAAPRF